MTDRKTSDEEAYEHFVAIADKLIQEGELDEESEFQLPEDESWHRERYVHVSLIFRGVALGVLGADPWESAEALPPGFSEFMAWIKYNINRVLGKDDPAPKTSLSKIYVLLRQWTFKDNRQFRDWAVRMNLEAALRNTMIWLRAELERIDRERAESDADLAMEDLGEQN